ncbi:MAG: glycosyltransferase family 4 protein, partial [Gemmatimonadota bacterium]
MKVLMTADAVGGVWTYALELANALAPHDAETTLAVMGPAPTAAQLENARRCPALTVRHRKFRLEWMDDPWRDVQQAGSWLLDIASRMRPDVVHINGYTHAALPWSAPVIVAVHSCVLSWWRGVHGSGAPPCYEQYRCSVQKGLHAADRVVAPTRAILSAVESHYGTVGRSAFIPNARDPEAFTP